MTRTWIKDEGIKGGEGFPPKREIKSHGCHLGWCGKGRSHGWIMISELVRNAGGLTLGGTKGKVWFWCIHLQFQVIQVQLSSLSELWREKWVTNLSVRHQ